jgi:transposase-like protein
MASANTGKRKALAVATKFEIIQACESGNVSKSEIGRHYNLSSSTLYNPEKTKTKLNLLF